MKTKSLNVSNIREVEVLDKASGNNLSIVLEDIDYVWGIFDCNKLVGYCSIGYADNCGKVIDLYKGDNNDALLISDVFILKSYRNNGYGRELLKNVIKKNRDNKQLIFVMLLDKSLSHFYKQIGFVNIDDYTMVYK